MPALSDSRHLPRSGDPATLVPGGTADPQASSGTTMAVPASQVGSKAVRRMGRSPRRQRGDSGVGTGPQPHQHQNVRQYNVVTLRASGPVGLEMETATFHEGHCVVVVEGDVGLVSEFPAGRHWISWVCEAAWMPPSAPSTPWEPLIPNSKYQGQACLYTPASARDKTLPPPMNPFLLSLTHHKVL